MRQVFLLQYRVYQAWANWRQACKHSSLKRFTRGTILSNHERIPRKNYRNCFWSYFGPQGIPDEIYMKMIPSRPPVQIRRLEGSKWQKQSIKIQLCRVMWNIHRILQGIRWWSPQVPGAKKKISYIWKTFEELPAKSDKIVSRSYLGPQSIPEGHPTIFWIPQCQLGLKRSGLGNLIVPRHFLDFSTKFPELFSDMS